MLHTSVSPVSLNLTRYNVHLLYEFHTLLSVKLPVSSCFHDRSSHLVIEHSLRILFACAKKKEKKVLRNFHKNFFIGLATFWKWIILNCYDVIKSGSFDCKLCFADASFWWMLAVQTVMTCGSWGAEGPEPSSALVTPYHPTPRVGTRLQDRRRTSFGSTSSRIRITICSRRRPPPTTPLWRRRHVPRDCAFGTAVAPGNHRCWGNTATGIPHASATSRPSATPPGWRGHARRTRAICQLDLLSA